MYNLGKWRLPALALLPCGVLAVLFQFKVVSLVYEADAVLSFKGEIKQLPAGQPGVRVMRGASPKTVRLIAQGSTPSDAMGAADAGGAAIAKRSLDYKKGLIRKKIAALRERQTGLSATLTKLRAQRESATQGRRQAWTPEMATRLSQALVRHRVLAEGFPSHTDIPLLAQEIKSLEAIKRGHVKIDRARINQLSKQVNEAQAEMNLLAARVRWFEQAEKTLRPDWTVVKGAVRPTWPVGIPGWPIAAGSVLAAAVLGWFVLKNASRRAAQGEEPGDTIPLELADEPSTLPDDPQTRKAASLYDRWLALAQTVYAPRPEAPKDIYTSAEPLFAETVAFLENGQDTMTRHLARVVIPGDLFSHVARTVLMALIGAYEAGASAAQQQGMTFAALFHDIAVAPRPGNAWQEIGSEVGRLSSGLLRKIPGIPAPLLEMVEEILVAMDEYPLETWQNVPRNPEVASFAKLLNHIDRFDKVIQKQKTRITRRIAAGQ